MSTAIDLRSEPQPQGARLVTVDGRALPLVHASLDVDARGGVARVVLTQTFRNDSAEALTVRYSLPLPHEGAVSGFEFTLGQDRVVGEVDRRESARERFEEALVLGQSAALLEQDRASLFTQEIGNLPPHTDLVARITVDQRLRWRDEGAWEWRFPTVVAPRYLGAPGRVRDADRIAQDVADGPLSTRAALALSVRDPLVGGDSLTSPSHTLHTASLGSATQARFADDDGARLDRDVVVRWSVSGGAPGVSIDVGRPALQGNSFGLLTVVPPIRAHAGAAVRRDVILLLDTSGSMSGAPMDQLRRVSAAIVDTLIEGDTLEIIEFSNRPRRWRDAPAAITAKVKHDAHAWLRKLRAGGGTEMRSGIMEALQGARAEAQRQVVLITDGQIGFELEVVQAIAQRLPAGSRVHTVGIGSAVNRSLTGPAARAGRGVEVIIGYDEDPSDAARALTRRTDAPLRVDLSLAGSALVSHAPRAMPDLFAAAPAQICVELRPEGGELVLRARGADGLWEQRVTIAPCAPGEGALHTAALFARERVEDLETELAAGASPAIVDSAIEAIGLGFQIATRRTSWVAIREGTAVDPRAPSRRERMPHELPDGMCAEALGLRGAMSAGPVAMMAMPAMAAVGGFAAAMKSMPRPASLALPGAPPRQGRASKESAKLKRSPAPALKRSKSVVESVRDFFLGERDEAPAERADDASVAPSVRGRVVRHDGRALTLEITAPDGGMDWDPSLAFELQLADGSLERCLAEVDRCTRAGHVAAGLVIRLVLTLPDDGAREPVALRAPNADGSVRIIAL